MAVDFELRPKVLADGAFLTELFAANHEREFAALGLPEQALADLLAMQAHGQAMSYAARFPSAVDSIMWVQGSRVGRMLLDHGSAGLHLVDLALLPAYQRQGIGPAMMRSLCRQAADGRLPLTLVVRETNPAKRLYERAGLVVESSDGLDARMVFRP